MDTACKVKSRRITSLGKYMSNYTQPCPKHDVTLCRCNLNPSEMIHGIDASFYPKAGCFRLGNSLYPAREYFEPFGRHMWESFIHNPAGVSQRYLYSSSSRFDYRGVSFYMLAGTGVSFYFLSTMNGLLPSVHIRRIQRAMRTFLQRKYEQRALATTMGLHGRLGDTSCLSRLPEDVLVKILAF